MSMKVAAARAIADIVSEDGVTAEYIVPSIFDSRVVPAVSREVQKAAAAAGLVTAPGPKKATLT
jgi:Malic enzyme